MQMAAALPPIAPGLFTDEPDPRLLGGRDPDTGRLLFPCPPGWQAVALSRDGHVWSWTVQRFRPKSPPYAGADPFELYVVAYVELPELVVCARLVGIAPEDVRLGMAVTLAPMAFERADGGAALIPAFAPAEQP